MNLSKACDCLDHDLHLVKLDAYGFDTNAHKLIRVCFYHKTLRVLVNRAFRAKPGTPQKLGVPQGSVFVLNFRQHVHQFCMRANQKLYAIARATN